MPLALAMNEPIVRSVFPRLPQRRRSQKVVFWGPWESFSCVPLNASWHTSIFHLATIQWPQKQSVEARIGQSSPSVIHE